MRVVKIPFAKLGLKGHVLNFIKTHSVTEVFTAMCLNVIGNKYFHRFPG